MLFNSAAFLIFFPIVSIVYLLLPGKLRRIFLLAASYYFYMSWNAKYAVLILFSTVVTWLSGLAIEKVRTETQDSNDKSRKKEKAILAACITVNLAILFVFKYLNFSINTISAIRKILIPGADSLGTLNLLLPVGISFYTFQALGYVIDCYRGDFKAEKSFIRYALFVSFYPQLVAGPIERSKNLLAQINTVPDKSRKELFNYDRIRDGLFLMLWGMFLKLVIADRVGILVDYVFDNYYKHGTGALILGAIGFGIQIYCDFGSYSTIAAGAAEVMGFNLMENFVAPYFAQSVTDFWRRWHISLSIWFRDYLYIPLGGNRRGLLIKLRNLMITFAVSGLWHGAAWTYVFWGILHGLYHVVESLIKPLITRIKKDFEIPEGTFGVRFINAVITFAAVDFAWIFFRAPSIKSAFDYIRVMFTTPDFWLLEGEGLYTLGLNAAQFRILSIALLALLFADIVREKTGKRFDRWMAGQWAPFRIICGVTLLVVTVVFGVYGAGFDARQFIYFQF